MRPARRRGGGAAAAAWAALGRGLVLALAATARAAAPPCCAPPPLALDRAPRLRVGVEFEVVGLGEPQVDAWLAAAPPPGGRWLGRGSAVAGKGVAHPGWRAVPELAPPLGTVEIISGALSYGEARRQVPHVAAQLAAAGARTDADAAFHVHVEHGGAAQPLTAAQLGALTQLWGAQQPTLLRLSHTGPRQRALYCRDLPAGLLAALAAALPPDKAALQALFVAHHRPERWALQPHNARRYHALNLAGLAGGTVEFRSFQFGAAPAPEQALAFVELSLALVALAQRNGTACLAGLALDPDLPGHPEALLDAIGLAAPRHAASRAALLANAAAPRPFALIEGEATALAWDGAAVALAATFAWGRGGAAPGARRGAVARLAWGTGEGLAAAAAARLLAFGCEAAGLTSYLHTAWARELPNRHFALGGALVGALGGG